MRPVWVSSLRRRGFFYMAVSLVFILQVLFALVGPVRLTVRARIARHHLLSVPALLAGHPMRYAPQAGKTNRFGTKRPIYQDGLAWRTAQEIHGHLDQPSTLALSVRSVCRPSALHGCADEACALWDQALLEVAPRRNQQSPRKRHHTDAAHPRASAGEAPLIPPTERAFAGSGAKSKRSR
jgi:hypothetical protein